MNFKVLEKNSIFIYPVLESTQQETNKIHKKKERIGQVKSSDFVLKKNFLEQKNLEFKRSAKKNFSNNTYTEPLFPKKELVKVLTPKKQKEWLDDFIRKVDWLKKNQVSLPNLYKTSKVIKFEVKSILRSGYSKKKPNKRFRIL